MVNYRVAKAAACDHYKPTRTRTVQTMKPSVAIAAISIILSSPLASSQDQPIPANVLLEATSIRYTEMKAAGIQERKSYSECCSWFASVGTPLKERSYPPSKAYLVKVKIDARALTAYFLKDTCERHGIFDPSTECDEATLSQKVDASLAKGQIGDLYGKYRAGFNAYNGDELIRHTEKFGGYDIYEFKRTDGIDELVVGPMPGNPTRFVLGTDLGSIPVRDFHR